ncbi:MAG: DUF115 domain-containing protein [Simkaniaceae bacterium]|nr:DUF115 domain-containing protein [Simkaniaceae bacterium]
MNEVGAFAEHFPELDFLLRFLTGPALPPSVPLGWTDEALASLPSEEIETLYLYGTGRWYEGSTLLDWLAADGERDLVFFEEKIEMLRLFANSPAALRLIRSPRVHIRFLMDPRDRERFIDESAVTFPREKIAFIPSPFYEKTKPALCRTMRLHLMRRTTMHHAIETDNAFYHVLSRNLIANIPKAGDAFYVNRFAGAFNATPAIICGAGPSLNRTLGLLRQKKKGALLFAGGSAITALSRAGILPHFAIAIDPNEEERERFRRAALQKTPLLYTGRLHPGVFPFVSGPLGYIRAGTGGPLEEWLEKELGIEPLPLAEGFDPEALSVTTTCLEVATMMGCSPIILVGVDLAFTDGMPYADGVLENLRPISRKEKKRETRVSEQLLIRKGTGGKRVRTLVKWVMESEAISRFAKANPNVTYLNGTPEGLGFPDIPYVPLDTLPLSPLPPDGKIEELITRHRLLCQGSKAVARLREALEECREIVHKAVRETEGPSPRSDALLFYDLELRDLPIFEACLHRPTHGMWRRFARICGRHTQDNAEKLFALMKWREYEALITYYLKSLQDMDKIG